MLQDILELRKQLSDSLNRLDHRVVSLLPLGREREQKFDRAPYQGQNLRLRLDENLNDARQALEPVKKRLDSPQMAKSALFPLHLVQNVVQLVDGCYREQVLESSPWGEPIFEFAFGVVENLLQGAGGGHHKSKGTLCRCCCGRDNVQREQQGSLAQFSLKIRRGTT